MPLDAGFYEELEEVLVAGDLGPRLAARVTEGVRRKRPNTLDLARLFLEQELVAAMSQQPRWLNVAAKPSAVLLYGINGAGKTTTAGKLAHGLARDGRKVLLVAADTYRAAGIEQALVWAERAGVEGFAGKAGGDAAAALFDGLKLASARGVDVAVGDTPGRLQTQQNLIVARALADGLGGYFS